MHEKRDTEVTPDEKALEAKAEVPCNDVAGAQMHLRRKPAQQQTETRDQ